MINKTLAFEYAATFTLTYTGVFVEFAAKKGDIATAGIATGKVGGPALVNTHLSALGIA